MINCKNGDRGTGGVQCTCKHEGGGERIAEGGEDLIAEGGERYPLSHYPPHSCPCWNCNDRYGGYYSGGGGVSGNTASVNPPETSPCGHCWFSDLRAYPSRYGGGPGGQKHITIEGLEDFNRTLRSLGALIEDIAVSLDIEIKARNLFTEGRMMNGFTSESPGEVMEEKSGMGSSQAGISSKI